MKRRLLLLLLLLSCSCFLLVLCLSLAPASPLTTAAEDALSQIPLAEAESPVFLSTPDDPYELYYLYDFLYIGDSFIKRLADSGILHESCTVLAKSGTSPKDWYVQEDNERYVDFLAQLQALSGTPFRGIIVNYGINNIMSTKNLAYTEQLIDDIHNTFPETPLFYLRLMPVAEQFVIVRDEKVAYTSEEINRGEKQSVALFNEAVERFCRRRKNVYFVDPTEGFLDERGDLKADYADERGLHIAPEYIPDWCLNIFDAVTAK